MNWVAPFVPDRGRTSSAPLLAQLAILGIQPHVSVRVESYQAVPFLITGTDRVALMQARLAEKLAAPLDLRIMPMPGRVGGHRRGAVVVRGLRRRPGPSLAAPEPPDAGRGGVSAMSAAEHWQVQGREAELYERHLVPAVTALWAAELVERADVRPGDRVLDVACGTGVVARAAA